MIILTLHTVFKHFKNTVGYTWVYLIFMVKNNNPYGSERIGSVYPLGKAEHHVSVNR